MEISTIVNIIGIVGSISLFVYVGYRMMSGRKPIESLEFDETKEAKLVLLNSGYEVVVPKGAPIRGYLDPKIFGCGKGYCGTCLVNVKSGMDNLSERTSKEPTSGTTRKLCQATIEEGIVELKV